MPKKKQIRKFLKRNGWRKVRDTDHEYYEKVLASGEVLRTRLSHGDGEIPPRVWRDMLKQIRITQEEFNAGL